ncbi:ranBP-type and C3HC4-type zinc finger-containing protein 1-like [Ostrea edulis]|uniref:ranBP-type and C3HC4-type zinc finger-containing protein 1-like n=1 Tax=Ostrea edulis TaxID=37623 RepID=UPI0024AF8164|nr:ranBP-type and C3HC4-type zinc finger-containing protein 1-like [Ostrea edulis]
MMFQQLSSKNEQVLNENPLTVEELKNNIAALLGIQYSDIDVVHLEDGIIFENDREIQGLSTPLQIMVGNPERTIPPHMVTTEPDMIMEDDEPRLKMSCGHAITPYNLFGHMKYTLMSKVKPAIYCLTSGCDAQWNMQEIARKADMTEDEIIFYDRKISFNLINQDSNSISECPSCGQFCQRQDDFLRIRCTVCSKKNGSAFDFCWDCKAPWIANHECSNKDLESIQRVLNDAPLKKIDMSKIEDVPSKRMCPECRFLIEHIKACKTMQCTHCNTIFCFVCLEVAVNRRLPCGNYDAKCTVAPVQNVFEPQ